MTDGNLHKEHYVRLSLFSLSGPLLWVFHFAFVYVVQLFLCSVSEGEAGEIVRILILALSAVIVFGLVLLIVKTQTLMWRVLQLGRAQWRYRQSTLVFLRFLIPALAGMSLVAVIWTTSAVLFLPACGLPY